MTAPQQFRRRAGETIEARQFDGYNEIEIRDWLLSGTDEILTSWWRLPPCVPGDWFIRSAAPFGVCLHFSDREFKEAFEPVPVPSEWVSVEDVGTLYDRFYETGEKFLGVLLGEVRIVVADWQQGHAPKRWVSEKEVFSLDALTHFRPLPDPPPGDAR